MNSKKNTLTLTKPFGLSAGFKVISTLLFLLLSNLAITQEEQNLQTIDSSFYGISANVQIDSIVISASKKGFDIQDFIKLMLEDESFYISFKNLRRESFTFSNYLEFFDKYNQSVAKYNGITKQKFDGQCRWMDVVSEEITGNFRTDGHYSHYTSKLYDRIFITHDSVCTIDNLDVSPDKKQSKLEHQISMLKKLIFSPGIEADVPLVGKKMAIFSKEMSKYYNYQLNSTKYKDEDCYLFSVRLKPKYRLKKKKKTIIKHLDTYFKKDDLQVVARNYHLAYKNALYNFDVNMNIEIDKNGNKYVPTYVNYDGIWDLVFKKPEIAKFAVKFYDFQ